MNAAIRTEWRKIASTRLWWLLALAMGGYLLVMGAIMAGSFVFGMRANETSTGMPGADPVALQPYDIASSVYTLAVALGYIFPAVLGALVVTNEFRYHTITPTLLAEPNRTRVLMAKLIAAVPFGLAVAVAGVLGTVVGGAATLAVLGEPTFLSDPDMLRTIGLSVLALVLWTLVGVGFGSVLTNQVAAIVVLLLFTQFVEPLLRILLATFDATEAISKFLPGAAGEAIAGSSLYVSSGLAELLPSWQGILVLLGYAAVLVIVGRLTTFRRDIG